MLSGFQDPNQGRATSMFVRLMAIYPILFILCVFFGSVFGRTVIESFDSLGGGVQGGILYGSLGCIGMLTLFVAVYQLYIHTASAMSRNKVYLINILLSVFAAVLIGFIVNGLFSRTAGVVVGGLIFLLVSFVLMFSTSEERLARRQTDYLDSPLMVQPDKAFLAPLNFETTFWTFMLGGLIGGAILGFGVKSIEWGSRDLIWLWALLRSFSVIGAAGLLHSLCASWAKQMENNDSIAQYYLSGVIAIVIGGIAWLLLGGWFAPIGIGGISFACLLFSSLKARDLLFTRQPASEFER